MGYSILKTAFDLVQKQESYEFFPEVESVKTSSYRNPAYDNFYEKRIASRESAWKTEQNMWKWAKSTDPCSAPLWIILTFTLKKTEGWRLDFRASTIIYEVWLIGIVLRATGISWTYSLSTRLQLKSNSWHVWRSMHSKLQYLCFTCLSVKNCIIFRSEESESHTDCQRHCNHEH